MPDDRFVFYNPYSQKLILLVDHMAPEFGDSEPDYFAKLPRTTDLLKDYYNRVLQSRKIIQEGVFAVTSSFDTGSEEMFKSFLQIYEFELGGPENLFVSHDVVQGRLIRKKNDIWDMLLNEDKILLGAIEGDLLTLRSS